VPTPQDKKDVADWAEQIRLAQIAHKDLFDTAVAGYEALDTKIGQIDDSSNNFLNGFTRGLENSAKGIGSFAESWNTLSDDINKLAPDQAISALSSIGKSLGINDSIIGKFSNGLKSGAEGLTKLITSYIGAADVQQKMSNHFLENAAAVGNLNQYFDKGNAAIDTATKSYKNLVEEQKALYGQITELSKATGVSDKDLTSLYNNLQTLPRAFDNSGKAIDILSSKVEAGGQSYTALEAITKISAATHTSLSAVTENVSDAIKNYNLSLTDAIEYVGRLSEVSNKLGVRLDIVKDFGRKVAQEFGLMGNQTKSAMEGFAEMVEGFIKTGMTAERASVLVGHFDDGLHGLSITQKAFLSQMTGGPGGLMGGMQIEKLLAEGNYGEVMKKTEVALKKMMGGNLVSFEQATKSEAAAAQFQKQRMLLENGPMGRFVQGDQEANKMIQMMMSGKTATKDDFKLADKTALLANNMTTGTEFQKENTNAMHGLTVATEQATVAMLMGKADTHQNITRSEKMIAKLEEQINEGTGHTRGINKENLGNFKDPNKLFVESMISGTQQMGSIGAIFTEQFQAKITAVNKEVENITATNAKSKQYYDSIASGGKIKYTDAKRTEDMDKLDALYSEQKRLGNIKDQAEIDFGFGKPKTEAEKAADKKESAKPSGLTTSQSKEGAVDVKITGMCFSCHQKMVIDEQNANKLGSQNRTGKST
jgi:hypothetical protein